MSLFPLGLISQGGGATGGNALTLISTTIVSSATATISFASIPSTYKHLQIRLMARTTAGSYQDVEMRFNSDTGTNYTRHQLYGQSSAVSSTGNTTLTSIRTSTVEQFNSGSGVFAPAIIDILDYSQSTKNKTVRTLSGYALGVGSASVRLNSGVWLNTATISSIDFTLTSGNYEVGSRLSLYGVS